MRTLLDMCKGSLHLSPRRRSAAKANSTAGFTLIELLVVIAIIGLLSSVVLTSLGTARAKGRDARRLSDLKQIANSVALLGENTAFTGCTTAGAITGCTLPAIGGFIDPTGTSACGSMPAAGNQCYRVSSAVGNVNPTATNWQVCAWMEQNNGSLAGPAVIKVGSDTSYAIAVGSCTN